MRRKPNWHQAAKDQRPSGEEPEPVPECITKILEDRAARRRKGPPDMDRLRFDLCLAVTSEFDVEADLTDAEIDEVYDCIDECLINFSTGGLFKPVPTGVSDIPRRIHARS